MQEFKIGEQVRINLRSGTWVVKAYDPESETYTIQQEEKKDEPQPTTMRSPFNSNELEMENNMDESIYIEEKQVKSHEIQALPIQRILDAQDHLGISDRELAVLRKIDSFKSQQYPYSIPNGMFDESEFNSIQQIIEKQSAYFMGEKSIYGEGDFLTQDEDRLNVTTDFQPILQVYEGYRTS